MVRASIRKKPMPKSRMIKGRKRVIIGVVVIIFIKKSQQIIEMQIPTVAIE